MKVSISFSGVMGIGSQKNAEKYPHPDSLLCLMSILKGKIGFLGLVRGGSKRSRIGCITRKKQLKLEYYVVCKLS